MKYIKLSFTDVVRAVVKVNITVNTNQEMLKNPTVGSDQLIKTYSLSLHFCLTHSKQERGKTFML